MSDIRRFLQNIKRAPKNIEFLSDDELLNLPVGTTFIFDAEIYVNFFFLAFKLHGTNKHVVFERSDWHDFNTDKLSWMLFRFKIISFNGINFDIPLIFYALQGATPDQLKIASDDIINNSLFAYAFSKQYRIEIPTLNHIDLMEVAPLSGSLKLYGARLHAKRLQDLPYPPNWVMDETSAQDIREYCTTDLDVTELLFDELQPEIKLREDMSNQYGIDLRSKSDAQIAEAVICNELKKVLGYYPKKPTYTGMAGIKYNVPDNVKFKNPKLQDVLEQLKTTVFPLDGGGRPSWPEGFGELDDKGKWGFKVKIADTVYKMGIGGLHSQEKNTFHVAGSNIILRDQDVSSYYPNIILSQGLYPEHLGTAFLEVYRDIVTTRLQAKKDGNKVIANSLKITINGSFGKLGEQFSRLYSPQLMLQVTISGQLYLLMLVERMEEAGIQVVSGNTDGIILKYLKTQEKIVEKVIEQWEEDTRFETEETRYKAVYSRDVNNYIAIKDLDDETPEEKEKRSKEQFLDDRLGVKTKGWFAERGSALNSVLSKNAERQVVVDAIIEYLVNEKPISETVKNCKDFRRFLTIRNVKGGGCKGNYYLGKIVRWYYGQNEKEAINYISSGNKVANTDAAVPVMDLPDEFPKDVDFNFYIREANEVLYNLGVKENPFERILI